MAKNSVNEIAKSEADAFNFCAYCPNNQGKLICIHEGGGGRFPIIDLIYSCGHRRIVVVSSVEGDASMPMYLSPREREMILARRAGKNPPPLKKRKRKKKK